MSSISAVLIVKNEGSTLANCLERLQWVDEIVVVDSGSTDDTLEIARQFTPHVFVESDWQGYGVQRQRAQARANSDWILMVDADEHVTAQLRDSIHSAIKENDQATVYAVPRLSWCFGRFIRHGGWYPDYVVRLYPNNRAHYGDDKVHEHLQYPNDMKQQILTGDLLHYTYRDLEHYLIKSAHYASAWAEQRVQSGKSVTLLQGFLHGIGCFLKMYVLHLGFLDGRAGLLLALLSGHSTFAKYADLWVRCQAKPAVNKDQG